MKYEGYLFPVWNFTLTHSVKEAVQRYLLVVSAVGFGLLIWKVLSQTGGGRMLSKDKLKVGILQNLFFINLYLSSRLWSLAILEMELGMFVMWTIQMVTGAASPVFITWIRTGTPRWVSHRVETQQMKNYFRNRALELSVASMNSGKLLSSWSILHLYIYFLGVYSNPLEVRIWTVSSSFSLPSHTHAVLLL